MAKKGMAIISAQKAQILDVAIDRTERILEALKLVKSGISERSACLRCNIRFDLLRRWTFYKVPCNGEISKKYLWNTYISWQERVYKDAFECDYEEVPENAEELIDTIFENDLSERERYVLFMRYKDGLTLKEIGIQKNITLERVRQIEVKALQKIRIRIGKKHES